MGRGGMETKTGRHEVPLTCLENARVDSLEILRETSIPAERGGGRDAKLLKHEVSSEVYMRVALGAQRLSIFDLQMMTDEPRRWLTKGLSHG